MKSLIRGGGCHTPSHVSSLSALFSVFLFFVVVFCCCFFRAKGKFQLGSENQESRLGVTLAFIHIEHSLIILILLFNN